MIRAVSKQFHGDLYVTENGIATADDTRRIAFIEKATDGVASCIADDIPVKGYFYWSLLDNFELIGMGKDKSESGFILPHQNV